MTGKVTVSRLCIWTGNLFVATITFAAIFLMNYKNMSKGMPEFAIPLGIMMVLMFECCYLMLTDEKSSRIKAIVLIPFGIVSLGGLIYAYNY